jgi:pyruvate dehydrogenase E1 component beta subunit
MLREGSDITLVSWGASLVETLEAASMLTHQFGISAEVIDVASIKPLDIESILYSIHKTGRCVIIHEGARTSGFGAEIASQIMEHAFHALKAPVLRVTGYDTIMPYFKLEKYYLPSVKRITETVMQVLENA